MSMSLNSRQPPQLSESWRTATTTVVIFLLLSALVWHTVDYAKHKESSSRPMSAVFLLIVVLVASAAATLYVVKTRDNNEGRSGDRDTDKDGDRDWQIAAIIVGTVFTATLLASTVTSWTAYAAGSTRDAMLPIVKTIVLATAVLFNIAVPTLSYQACPARAM